MRLGIRLMHVPCLGTHLELVALAVRHTWNEQLPDT